MSALDMIPDSGSGIGETIASGRRARRFGAWYVAEHRIRSMRSFLGTILATSLGSPLVYVVAFGVGLGTLVDSNQGAEGIEGVGYLAFVAPALIGLAAVMVAAEEFSYPLMMGFKWNPIFYAMNAAPISGGQIIDGLIIGVVARMLPTVTLFYGVMLLFGTVPLATGVLLIPISMLAAFAIGIPMMSYTARIEQDKGQLALLMRFGITPVLLFSGTFFPLDQLPIFLRWIGWISPLWHGTELGRVVSFGLDEPVWLTVLHVVYPLALIAVFWPICRRVAARRLDK